MKYELIKLDENHKFYGTGVKYQIKALRDFGDVKKGDLGGFVNKEYNLSQEGDCWVYDNGRACDDSIVCDNGIICNNGVVCEKGSVCNNGKVCGNGKVCSNGSVCGNGIVYNNGRVCGNGVVRYETIIRGDYVCTEQLSFGYLYKYIAQPVFDRQKPTHIRMGCFVRTIKEWQEDFYNNEKEFPKGSRETEQRLCALNYILMTLGEELVKE